MTYSVTKTKLKYILKSYVDEEGFDADGIGDYTYVAERYQSFDSKEKILSYLQKNIWYDDRKTKPNFNTIKEYCDTFEFELFERTEKYD
tara:strand:- start:453 stop:719 length:267 start_codon:yes stop_codon:yes gene_type:complete